MNFSKQDLWARFQRYNTDVPELGMVLDLSRMHFPENYLESLQPAMQKAFAEMADLERGAIANADEKRMVGHYWLRNPALAPTPQIRKEIEETVLAINEFAAQVHEGSVRGAGGRFRHVLIVGIGGSALGPQFVANALENPGSDKMTLHFCDNTDPDGIDRVFARLEGQLGATLVIVISKSGGTKETRNGMLEAQNAYQKAGLDFGRHTVAVTSTGSELSKFATKKGWLREFPMWDWVGGRTSELSAVGLLPAALQGFDIDQLLAGAKACDEVTRQADLNRNLAARLAAAWYFAGSGKGEKNMVVLPYKDRLELLAKYLQQLIMESLGKELDRNERRVNQGLTVLGNKGSTDQHSYIQQLRDGLDNFFVTFIEVLKDRATASMEVEPGITSGDYLQGFLLGTRTALFESGRQSITLTVKEVSPFTVGALIALFERTVGLYASLINVNAYHQPGVEAGKKAATVVLNLQTQVLHFLQANKGKSFTAEEIARIINNTDEVETVFQVCRHLAVNRGHHGIAQTGSEPAQAQFGAILSL